jgi:hypothetical protein
MSRLTLKTPNGVSCRVIPDHVLSSQAVHLQVQLVIGIVSEDGESALHRVCLVCVTTIVTN